MQVSQDASGLENSGPKLAPIPRRLYQRGAVLIRGHKWFGRWREDVLAENGRIKTVRRTGYLGTVNELPTEQDARMVLIRFVRQADFTRRALREDALKDLKVRTRKTPAVRQSNPRQEGVNARARMLLRKYKTTPEEVEYLREKQEGCCAICKEPAVKLVIDHDHQTTRRRALLCGHCNSGLGFFRDRPEVLRSAADYLESHNRNQ